MEAFLPPFLPLSFTRGPNKRVPTPLHPFIQSVGQGQACAAEGQESANSVRRTNIEQLVSLSGSSLFKV